MTLGSGRNDCVYNYRVIPSRDLPPKLVAAVIHNEPAITSVVGKVAFDGAQAFLLNRLEEDETTFNITTRGNERNPPEQITITFKFNHIVPWGSPTILQVLNILLKQYVF